MNRNILIIVGIVVAALLFVGTQSAFTVHQREQALVLRFGQVTRAPITEAGLHFKVPFIENVVRFDKRILGFEAQAQEIIAADQRRLVVDTFARFRIVDSLKFYTTVNSIAGLRARLSSLMDSSVRGVLGRMPVCQSVGPDPPVVSWPGWSHFRALSILRLLACPFTQSTKALAAACSGVGTKPGALKKVTGEKVMPSLVWT